MRSVPLFAAILALAGCASGDYRDTSVPIATMAEVDLTRYAGKWYEIARFPNSFERGCQGVTAEYAPRPDGRIDVLNTCRKGSLDGPVETARGVARATDAAGAKLAVKFVPWLPFEGDYWILDVDAHYSTAVVGTPGGSTGWILARSPRISAGRRDAALAALARNGYDPARLFWTPQPKAGAE